MRFVSRTDVFLPSDIVERAPGLWDKVCALWAPVDLRTDRLRNEIEGATFLLELRRALDTLGIDNARSLVVDGVTVFHDAQGRPSDLPDLFDALADHVSVFGERSQELRLGVEREEAGLHLVLEATVTSEHRKDTPSARIEVVGELVELAPRAGESAEEYRDRIEPLVTDGKLSATLRLQFGAFVSRLEQALVRVFPDTRFATRSEVEDAAAMPREEADPPKAERSRTPAVDTAAPARNFTIASETRLGALLSGPPPYAVRLRKIEDLEADMVTALCACERVGGADVPIGVARGIEQVNRLIQDHNRFYPVEANLPLDAGSGQLLEMGEPWRPTKPLTIDGLRAKARARAGRRA